MPRSSFSQPNNISRYINTGNSKFGAITIEDYPGAEQSSLHYRLFVDGVEAWNTTILSPAAPVHKKVASEGSFWSMFGITKE